MEKTEQPSPSLRREGENGEMKFCRETQIGKYFIRTIGEWEWYDATIPSPNDFYQTVISRGEGTVQVLDILYCIDRKKALETHHERVALYREKAKEQQIRRKAYEEAKEFIPELLTEDLVVCLILVQICRGCKRPLRPNLGSGDYRYGPYSVDDQWSRAKWPLKGVYISPEEAWFCLECSEKGLATWTCACCKQERTGEPQKNIGWPPESLCTSCYETIPAKTWEELVDSLKENHQHDYT